MQKTIPFTIVALGLAAFAMPARAGVVDDTSLATPPGVYYGSGNANTNWVVDTENGVELGLNTVNRFIGAVAPESPTSNIYDVPLGNTTVPTKTGAEWGFAFSAINTSGLLSALTLNLSILDVLSGQTVSFNPTIIPDNSGTDGTNVVGGGNGCLSNPTSTACVAATQTGLQNGEALSFAGFDPTYDSSVNNSWVITLTASEGGNVVGSTTERVNAGTGVPEPASMALLGSALLGLGAARRRRRKV